MVSPEPDSTNQGDSSHTLNTSGAGSGRQREQERRQKKSLHGIKLPGRTEGSEPLGRAPTPRRLPWPLPVSARARPADASSLRWEPGEKARPTPYSGAEVRVSETGAF